MPLTEQEKQLARILTDPVLWAEATLMSPEQGKSSEYIKLRDCQVEILKDKSIRKCTRMGRRLGKCIPFDANVITATGRMTAFELCSSDDRPPIVTYDEETSRIVSTRNYHIWNNGVKPVYKIKTSLGRAAEATGNHPFLVMNNNKTEWKELDTLIIGDLIAVPSTYENVIEGIDIDDILPGLIQDLIDNESCPREIFQGTKENIRKVIDAYWKHNGWINIRNGPDIGVLASTFSLARDIQHLLLRIGINAKIEKRESEKDSYTVYIYDTLDIAGFLDAEEPSQKKSSDILWDRITSIKYVGEKETYDISVPETHTLISDDIVSHNTTTMVIHILWYGFTRKDSKQVIAAPYDSQIRMIFDMLRQFIDNSPELRNSIASSTRNPHEIKLKNGASIKGFTAGTRSGAEGGSLRGQAADWLYMDELDYMTDGDFEAIYAIALADPKKIGVWVSSTPTGRRGMFYKMCMGIMPGWKEFYYPSMANPTWNEDMEKELRATFSGMGYVHEVLAEFGEETVGVFKKEYLDRAKATYQYSKEGNISNPTVLGVDWDKYGAATQMVVLEYNTIYEKFRVVAREEVEKSKFTLDNGVKKIIELNQRYNLDAIYVDRGYGEYQVETLHKYGMDHPETELHTKVVGISFGSSKSVIDPWTRKAENKPIKPFMVDQLGILFEKDKIIINENDDMMIRQLENYRMVKKTTKGSPVFTSDDEHTIDCLMLATLAFVEKFPKIIATVATIVPAQKIIAMQTKADNHLYQAMNNGVEVLQKDKAYLEWDEPGSQPLKRVEVGSKPDRKVKSMFGWSTRGTNIYREHKRKSW